MRNAACGPILHTRIPRFGGTDVKRLCELDQSGRCRRTYRERRRLENCSELAMPGDYHLPFGKTEARTEVAKWVWEI